MLENKPIVFSRTAKKYQFPVFYERELKLWNENPVYDGVPLKIWLYHNRLTYLGKNPKQLTMAEIMRGFTISGILKGYTAFNTSLMHMVVGKYDIQSIYDPCAGWGERMLYCQHNQIRYSGVDVNLKLKPGYEAMMLDLEISDQEIVWADSSEFRPVGVYDAVLTCPPYGNIEIYSDLGAENLPYADFLIWWEQVVQNCLLVSPKYFCVQINRKYRDAMLEPILDSGFSIVDEFYYGSNRSSHMTRRKGQNLKQEYESMIVLKGV